jgi:predicted Zn-dependent peptidase
MNRPPSAAAATIATTAATEPFAARVTEAQAGPCRLLVLPTPAEQVVSFRGSFRTLPNFAEGEELTQDLAASLLDKGTETRDRFALARVLEDRGAELSVQSSGLRVRFSGRALSGDVPSVLEVLAEMLRAPRFAPEEFEKERAQQAASLQHEMDDTGTQAAGALARALYGPAHPSYRPRPEASLETLEALTVEDVRAYHAAHVGADDFVMTAAGDVEPDALAAVVEEQFGDWDGGNAEGRFDSQATPSDERRHVVEMPDRDSVDVRLGHALPGVRRDADDYLPLYLANYVLGGNFSARLMRIVRDEKGLTYGTGSSLVGVSTEYDAYWKIRIALSQEKLGEGIEATRAVIEDFADGGVTGEELAEKKTTLTGSFTVGLASTGRLAGALLSNAERGFEVGYLDDFPREVEALTLDDVNVALRRHFRPQALHEALAGTLPG